MSKRVRLETPEIEPSNLLWEILNNLSINLCSYEEGESVFIKEKRAVLSKVFEDIKLAIYEHPEDHQIFSQDQQMDAIVFASKLLQTTVKVLNITPDPSGTTALKILRKSQRDKQQNDESVIETAMEYLKETVFRFSKRNHNSLDLCLICHEEFQSGQSVSKFPCYDNHEVHTSCVKVLLKTSFRCPICSASLDAIAHGVRG